MADVWLGKFLDKMDEMNLWKDTVVVLTTDHGHLLGEHGYWAKNYMFDYEELVHIPMIVCTPETVCCHRRESAITASMDLMPTFMELHGAELPKGVHGTSLMPLIRGEEAVLHDAILYGYFGKDINLFDGRYSYCRQPKDDSIVYHHTLMPRSIKDFLDEDMLKKAEFGHFLKPDTGIPQMRLARMSHRHKNAPDGNLIYDVKEDPKQSRPIKDKELEARLAEKMTALLEKYDAPDCQYERTGLNRKEGK